MLASTLDSVPFSFGIAQIVFFYVVIFFLIEILEKRAFEQLFHTMVIFRKYEGI